MATLSSLDAAVAAAILADSADSLVRLDSDFRDDRQPIAAATGNFQLVLSHVTKDGTSRPDSFQDVVEARVTVKFLASTQALERSYRLGSMAADLDTVFLLPTWWEGITGVQRAARGDDNRPALEEGPELDGLLIVYTVTALLWMEP